MKLRFGLAKAIGAVSTWGLTRVFHRPAANFPGKAGILADPQLIADLRSRVGEGVVVVAGTNGKTTVTNLIADTLEAAGKSVACNRTGANLDSGVATALLHERAVEWGVFESDELWLARIAPQLKPDFVILLNLFRDQLDRMGEIAIIQDSIVEALGSSPDTALVFNSDDPLCQEVANRVENRTIPFGIAEGLGLAQNTVADAGLCQECDELLAYEWRQYGQLGNYACPNCGFSRADPQYYAADIRMSVEGTRLTLGGGTIDLVLDEPFSGAYMIYNVLAAYVATDLCKAPFAALERAICAFDPQNGRLQRYEIEGIGVLLNLAKNPTGFNQNLRIVCNEPGEKAVAFFVNDKEADGHDVSWLWDVDFQELAWCENLVAFAGGTRGRDLQVRLKHAGIDAELVEGSADFLAKASAANPSATCFAIANYTALPAVKEELDRLQQGEEPSRSRGAYRPHGSHHREKSRPSSERAGSVSPDRVAMTSTALPRPSDEASGEAVLGCHSEAEGRRTSPGREVGDSSLTLRMTAKNCFPTTGEEGEKLTIVHLYPTLLNLYGDGGNVTILANRARWRGMAVEVRRVDLGQELDLGQTDIVFLGGGPDREQNLASRELLGQVEALRSYVEDDGVLLAICGGYQILGRKWLMGDEAVPGLGVIDAATTRASGDARNRLVGNVVLESPLASMPVVGYENHAGRTCLGHECAPFGRIVGKHGQGNNGSDGEDGALYRNVVGTYLHGPLLAKNPEVADWLIERALARQAAKESRRPPTLQPLDDAIEQAANEFMRKRT